MKGRVLVGGIVGAAFAVTALVADGLPSASGAANAPTVQVRASGAPGAGIPKVFTPANVEITVGDTVEFVYVDGSHNVHFDGGAPMPGPPPVPAWTTISRTFNTAGRYHYVCDVHYPNPGMEGTIVVKDAPTPTPTPTPPPPPPPPPAGGAPPPPPAQLRSVKLVRTSFCTRRSRTCKRPGVVLSIDLSAPAAVTGTLRRSPLRGKARYRAFGSVDFGQVAAGPRELRFSRTKTNRRLKPARYRLVLKAAGATRTLSFRIRPS